MRNFCILGHGHSGTTFLRSVLDDHPDIIVEFEPFDTDFKKSLDYYIQHAKAANDNGKVWGFKLPLEQVIIRNNHWKESDFIELSEHFDVIWIDRRFDTWLRSWNQKQEPKLNDETGLEYRKIGERIFQELIDRKKIIGAIDYHDFMLNFPDVIERLYQTIGVDCGHIPGVMPDPARHWVKEV